MADRMDHNPLCFFSGFKSFDLLPSQKGGISRETSDEVIDRIVLVPVCFSMLGER
jgi:hypothetical protein